MQPSQISNDLLTDEEFYTRASTGKRLANYIIDLVVLYILFFVLGIVVALISPNSLKFLDNDSGGFDLMDRIITILIYALYMSVVEATFQGKSIGKFITKTRAVNLDGSKISTKTAFERGFSRAVPFCVFSAFGTPCNPWQDKWTNTMVIDDKN